MTDRHERVSYLRFDDSTRKADKQVIGEEQASSDGTPSKRTTSTEVSLADAY
jgi:hypothetical protein